MVKMKTYLFIFLFSSFCAHAQDSLRIEKNQVYLEAFGNNFPGLPVSFNYSRKFIGDKKSFIVSSGVNYFRIRDSRFMDGWPDVSFNAGLLFRGKYKRNAFWGSVAADFSTGYWDIATGRETNPYNGQSMLVYTEHSSNFCFTSDLVYQLQGKTENFFLRIAVGAKISSSCFSQKYRDVDRHDFFYPNVGICIGHGFNPGEHNQYANHHYDLPSDTAKVISHNQVYVELLGNNFFDPNALSSEPGLASINYARKVVLKHNSFIFNIGIGPVKSLGYDPARNAVYTIFNIDFPTGFLWRPGYSPKGFWIGFFITPLAGKIPYLEDRNGFESFQKSSFEFSPNLTYQFQNKSEKFFYRLSITPKFYADNFSAKFGNGNTFWPFWGGISIGGGW